MTNRILMISAITIAAAGLAGCGEKASVTIYKQGKYQGKPDNLPWQGPAFNNDQAAWEKAIKTRTIGQNEYVRVGS